MIKRLSEFEVTLTNLANLSKKVKSILFLGIFMLIFLIIYYFMILSVKSKIESIDQLIKRNELKVIKKEKIVLNLEENKARLNNKKYDLKNYDQYFIKHQPIADLIHQITEKGLEQKLKFHLIKPLKEEISDGFIIRPIQIDVEGTYNDIGYFLQNINQIHYLVVTQRFELTSKDQSNNLTLFLLLNSYSEKVGSNKDKING